MNPFTLTFDELTQDFADRGIPYHIPGFCDHPSFLEVERSDPQYLNHYAAFVAKRYYDTGYLERAKIVIDEVISVLHAELIKNGRLGACVDISSILFRILEEERIWSCCVKGSLTVSFPVRARIPTRYFWSVDHGSFVAGHVWLFAPPYTVADISVQQQPYKRKEKEFIPQFVVTTNDKLVEVSAEDIVSPSVRTELLDRGVPPHLHLRTVASSIPYIFDSLPAIEVQGLRGAKLKYSPLAIHAPQEKLSDIRNMRFSGLTPWQLYKSQLAGKFNDRL